MRICLVNPPQILPRAWNEIAVYQPLGLAYIAAMLEQAGFSVRILDTLALGWRNIREINMNKKTNKIYIGLEIKDVKKYIRSYSPHVVGITIPFSTQSWGAFQVAKACKQLNPEIVTVAGGAHPSVRPIDTIKEHSIDIVVVGEGELTTLELVQRLDTAGNDRTTLKKVKGIAFMDGNNPVITPPRPPIKDLDSIPFPARHLLPMQEYFTAARFFLGSRGMRKPWAQVITSRGCPYNCVFCSIHTIWGRQWRARSPENVVDEIETLVNTYQIKEIDFEDDNLTLNRKRAERIFDLLIEKNLDIEWHVPNGVRADTLDETLLRKMKRSGCKTIWIGVESGDQNVLDNIIRKRLDLRTVEHAVKLPSKVGIQVGCFFVIGLIGETKESVQRTLNFARKLKNLGADRFWFSIATPYYGTELYKQAKEKGCLIDERDEVFSVHEALIETPDFTPAELLEIRKKAMRELNPNTTLFYLLRSALKSPIDAIRAFHTRVCSRVILRY